MSGQQHAPAALYPRERPGAHFTGGWVGPKAGLDGRKISSPPGFDPGPSSRYTNWATRPTLKYHSNRKKVQNNPMERSKAKKI